jgi:hypothetical protein
MTIGLARGRDLNLGYSELEAATPTCRDWLSVKLRSSSLCSSLQSVHFPLLRPKYPPHHPSLEQTQPMSFLNVTDQVQHPYKTVACILIFMFLHWNRKANVRPLRYAGYPSTELCRLQHWTVSTSADKYRHLNKVIRKVWTARAHVIVWCL